MSDDTPTQRFDAAGDAPTQRLSATQPTDVPLEVAEERKSRRLIIIFASIGGALLLGVLILLILLLTRGDGVPTASTSSPTPTASSTPSVSPTPSATPTPTPTPTPTATAAPPPPEETGPRFTSFSAPSTEGGCSAGGPGFPETRPNVEVSWASAGTDEAWFVGGSGDAAEAGYMQIPLNGNQNDFPFQREFNCGGDSDTFTITLVGPDGEHVNKTWTVENTGDQF
jgi:hypothetical protein